MKGTLLGSLRHGALHNAVLIILVSLLMASFYVKAADDTACADAASGQARYQRIVSIGGAITETIFALQQGHRIVASDTTSYYPKQANETPKVGYQRALSAEGVLSARPDLVIASDQAGPGKVIKQLKASGLTYLTLPTANSLEQVLDNTRAMGKLLCAQAQSADLIRAIKAQQSKLPSANDAPKQRVLFIMQHGDGAPMVAGSDTSAASIITLSGAQNAMTQFSGYKPLTPEALLMAKPDVILTTNRGLKQAGGIESMLTIPGLALTPAGKDKAIIAMDALLLLGFGPRTVQAASMLNHQLNTTL